MGGSSDDSLEAELQKRTSRCAGADGDVISCVARAGGAKIGLELHPAR